MLSWRAPCQCSQCSQCVGKAVEGSSGVVEKLPRAQALLTQKLSLRGLR